MSCPASRQTSWIGLEIPERVPRPRAAAKLLARDAATFAGRRAGALGEPGVAERAVAGAGERPLPALHAGAVAHRPAPGIAPLTAMSAPQLVLVPRLPQAGEGGRVAPALGEAVPAEAECV